MTPLLDYQLACQTAPDALPNGADLQYWLETALRLQKQQGDLESPLSEEIPQEITLRIVDEAEITDLNQRYRGKGRPTNVLSFPYAGPDIPLPSQFLGDIVICAAVVEQEAAEQGTALMAHWAHMLAHGLLHLIGYDHHTDTEAEAMERLEAQILEQLGFANPYTPRYIAEPQEDPRHERRPVE